MGIAHGRQAWLGLTRFGCLFRSCWTHQLRTTTLPFLTAVASLSLRPWSHSSLTPLAASIWLKTSLFTWASLWREALAAALVSPLNPALNKSAFECLLPHLYGSHLVLSLLLSIFDCGIAARCISIAFVASPSLCSVTSQG